MQFRLGLTDQREKKGVNPSLKNIELNLESAFHRYNDPPAVITCHFEKGESIAIYIGKEARVHAVIRDARGDLIVTHAQAGNFRLPKVQILPQIAPLEETEQVLVEGYVRRHMITSRSSLHFRNQLKVLYEYFGRFKKIAEITWPRFAHYKFGRQREAAWRRAIIAIGARYRFRRGDRLDGSRITNVATDNVVSDLFRECRRRDLG